MPQRPSTPWYKTTPAKVVGGVVGFIGLGTGFFFLIRAFSQANHNAVGQMKSPMNQDAMGFNPVAPLPEVVANQPPTNPTDLDQYIESFGKKWEERADNGSPTSTHPPQYNEQGIDWSKLVDQKKLNERTKHAWYIDNIVEEIGTDAIRLPWAAELKPGELETILEDSGKKSVDIREFNADSWRLQNPDGEYVQVSSHKELQDVLNSVGWGQPQPCNTDILQGGYAWVDTKTHQKQHIHYADLPDNC